jgi:hypothetical protein
MPDYKPYPNEKNTPNRKTRKGERVKTFLLNKAAGKKLRNAHKAERDARLEAAEETTEE